MRSKRAFTLVEMLVVVGIIGILAAISMAYLSEARKTAIAVTTLDQLREIENAITSYALLSREPLPLWPAGAELEDMTIGNMITGTGDAGTAFPGFSEFMAQPPSPRFGGVYSYMARAADEPIDCTSYQRGIYIRAGNAPALGLEVDMELQDFVYQYLNDVVDNSDDDPNCGRIRRGGASLSISYVIADSPNDY